MKILIYTEDTYAQPALRILTNKLKQKQIIPNHKITIKPIPGICSTKHTRMLRAATIEYDRVIVFVDGEGNPAKEAQRQQSHLPREPRLRQKTTIIVLHNSIEELILHAQNIPPTSHTPTSNS